MRLFFTKLLIFSLLFLGIDLLLGAVLTNLYSKVKSGRIFAANYAIRDCKEEILLLGASEISHEFISNTIKDSLGLSCYNLGIDDHNIFYQYSILQEIIKRHKPKIIIISASTISSHEPNTLKTLLPYCNNYELVRKTVIDSNSSEKYKLLSKCYPFNSLVIEIIMSITREEPITNGYKPYWGITDHLKLKTDPQKIKTTIKSINYFANFLQLAKNAGCLVYMVQTPIYQINNSAEDELLFTNLSIKYKVPFLNYLPDTIFINHPEYFKNQDHLNNQGAEILTNKLIADLKKYYVINQNSSNDFIVP